MPKAKTPEYGGQPPQAPPLAGASATDIRTKLVEALLLDLVGPSNSHAFAHELLPQSPRRQAVMIEPFYLQTVFLARRPATGHG